MARDLEALKIASIGLLGMLVFNLGVAAVQCGHHELASLIPIGLCYWLAAFMFAGVRELDRVGRAR